MIDSMLRKAIEARILASGLNWLRLQHFELKSTEKRLSITVQLEGEVDPVSLQLGYRVENEAIVLTTVEATRKWMTEALSMALLKHGGRFPLPTGVGGMVAKMLL